MAAPASALGKERGCSFRILGQRRRGPGSPSTRRHPEMGRGSGGLDALFSTGGEGEADRPIEFRSSARGNWLRRECKRKSPRSLRYPGPPGEFRVTSALRSSADGVLFCLRTRRSLGFSQSGGAHCGQELCIAARNLDVSPGTFDDNRQVNSVLTVLCPPSAPDFLLRSAFRHVSSSPQFHQNCGES